MTIKTVLWFTFGGAFSTLVGNKAMGRHFLWRPHVHVLSTVLGLLIGYKVSEFEDSQTEMLLKTKERQPLFVFHAKEELLTYQAILKRREELKAVGGDESFENADEDDDE